MTRLDRLSCVNRMRNVISSNLKCRYHADLHTLCSGNHRSLNGGAPLSEGHREVIVHTNKPHATEESTEQYFGAEVENMILWCACQLTACLGFL